MTNNKSPQHDLGILSKMSGMIMAQKIERNISRYIDQCTRIVHIFIPTILLQQPSTDLARTVCSIVVKYLALDGEKIKLAKHLLDTSEVPNGSYTS